MQHSKKACFTKALHTRATSSAAWGQQSLFKNHRYLAVQQNGRQNFGFWVLPAKFSNAFGNLNNQALNCSQHLAYKWVMANDFVQGNNLYVHVFRTRKLQDTQWFSPYGWWSASEGDDSTLNINGQTTSLTRGFGDVMRVNYSKCNISIDKMFRSLLLWRNWCINRRNCPRCSYALSTTYLFELK